MDRLLYTKNSSFLCVPHTSLTLAPLPSTSVRSVWLRLYLVLLLEGEVTYLYTFTHFLYNFYDNMRWFGSSPSWVQRIWITGFLWYADKSSIVNSKLELNRFLLLCSLVLLVREIDQDCFSEQCWKGTPFLFLICICEERRLTLRT